MSGPTCRPGMAENPRPGGRAIFGKAVTASGRGFDVAKEGENSAWMI